MNSAPPPPSFVVVGGLALAAIVGCSLPSHHDGHETDAEVDVAGASRAAEVPVPEASAASRCAGWPSVESPISAEWASTSDVETVADAVVHVKLANTSSVDWVVDLTPRLLVGGSLAELPSEPVTVPAGDEVFTSISLAPFQAAIASAKTSAQLTVTGRAFSDQRERRFALDDRNVHPDAASGALLAYSDAVKAQQFGGGQIEGPADPWFVPDPFAKGEAPVDFAEGFESQQEGE